MMTRPSAARQNKMSGCHAIVRHICPGLSRAHIPTPPLFVHCWRHGLFAFHWLALRPDYAIACPGCWRHGCCYAAAAKLLRTGYNAAHRCPYKCPCRYYYYYYANRRRRRHYTSALPPPLRNYPGTMLPTIHPPPPSYCPLVVHITHIGCGWPSYYGTIVGAHVITIVIAPFIGLQNHGPGLIVRS